MVLARMFPQAHEYARNPVGWIRSRLGEFCWSKQRAICRSVVHNRYTAVPSCHDSGKSFIASRIVSWWVDVHPPGEAFAITTAPTAHQVDAILWREIGRAHRKAGLPGRITLDSKWRLGAAHGDELIAYGRKPADYNPDSFQGIHQRYVLVVIDEANGVPKWLFDAVDTLVTNSNARVLAIGNPDSPASHFAHICKPNSGWNVIHIDGLKTPNFTDELVPDDLRDLLLSPEWVEERRARWGVGSMLWESKVRGRFPVVTDDTLIQPDWWDQAAERNLDPRGYVGQIGADIARYGDDSSMVYRNQGGYLRRFKSWTKTGTTKSAERILRMLNEEPGLECLIDGTGVGGGVYDDLSEKGAPVHEFISSRSPSDDRFHNLRAEAFWHLRELFEFGMIDVDPDDEELKSQLTSLKWTLTQTGKIKIESKDDYRKRMRSASPDAADAAMMACWDGPSYDPTLLDHGATPALTADLLEVIW